MYLIADQCISYYYKHCWYNGHYYNSPIYSDNKVAIIAILISCFFVLCFSTNPKNQKTIKNTKNTKQQIINNVKQSEHIFPRIGLIQFKPKKQKVIKKLSPAS